MRNTFFLASLSGRAKCGWERNGPPFKFFFLPATPEYTFVSSTSATKRNRVIYARAWYQSWDFHAFITANSLREYLRASPITRRTPGWRRCWRPRCPSRCRPRGRTRSETCRRRWRTARGSSSRWRGRSPRRHRCWCSAASIWRRGPVTGSRCRRRPSGWSSRSRRARGAPPRPGDAARTWTPPGTPWSSAPSSYPHRPGPRTGGGSSRECRSKLGNPPGGPRGPRTQVVSRLIEQARRLFSGRKTISWPH